MWNENREGVSPALYSGAPDRLLLDDALLVRRRGQDVHWEPRLPFKSLHEIDQREAASRPNLSVAHAMMLPLPRRRSARVSQKLFRRALLRGPFASLDDRAGRRNEDDVHPTRSSVRKHFSLFLHAWKGLTSVRFHLRVCLSHSGVRNMDVDIIKYAQDSRSVPAPKSA